MNLPIIQLSLALCIYCRLDPNVFLNNWVFNAPQSMLFSERERDRMSDPYEMQMDSFMYSNRYAVR
jgi:hypothetical protein